MKTHSSHDSFSNDDPSIDELFQLQDLAPNDFASRTVHVVRAHRRRARIYRFTAWTSAVAACLALFVSLAPLRNGPDSPGAMTTIAEAPSEPMPSPTAASPVAASPTADELTAALYASFSEDEVMFYGHASELEDLLEEAIALSDEENLQTLDMLILFAQN